MKSILGSSEASGRIKLPDVGLLSVTKLGSNSDSISHLLHISNKHVEGKSQLCVIEKLQTHQAVEHMLLSVMSASIQ